jgi:hypothetical protein
MQLTTWDNRILTSTAVPGCWLKAPEFQARTLRYLA